MCYGSLFQAIKNSDSTKVLSASCFSYLPLALLHLCHGKEADSTFVLYWGVGKCWLILAASEPVAEAGTARVLPRYRQNQPNLGH
jgi:hypothetical protein